MPKYAQSADNWFGRTLGAIAQTGQANSLQGTEYIVDGEGNCQAIRGNIAAEPDGTATGLAGFGVAVKLPSGAWQTAAALPVDVVSHVEWPGGSPTSNETTVEFGAGVAAVIGLIPVAASVPWFPLLTSRSGNQVKVKGYCPTSSPALGTKAEIGVAVILEA